MLVGPMLRALRRRPHFFDQRVEGKRLREEREVFQIRANLDRSSSGRPVTIREDCPNHGLQDQKEDRGANDDLVSADLA